MNNSKAPAFRVSRGCLEIRFLGRGAPAERQMALGEESTAPTDLAFLSQVHSGRIVEASPGDCGEADGLWTHRHGLALSITTADCVPVVVANQNRLAIAHAGWRGITAGIVGRTVQALGSDQHLAAWIGPAIGPCCYEVGTAVANQLASASSQSILTLGSRGRPHVDIPAAVAIQRERNGVREVHTLSACTRCRSEEFWSYRSCGRAAGRNFTFAWLGDRGEASASGRFQDSEE